MEKLVIAVSVIFSFNTFAAIEPAFKSNEKPIIAPVVISALEQVNNKQKSIKQFEDFERHERNASNGIGAYLDENTGEVVIVGEAVTGQTE